MIKIDIQLSPTSRLSEVDFADLGFGKHFSEHMFVADYTEGLGWHSCRVEPYQNLSLSPACGALHYGQALFEGMKAYKNVAGDVLLFRPDENCRRLNASAERMCMPTISEELFHGALETLLKIDQAWVPTTPNSSLYLRPYMFASEAVLGVRPSREYKYIIFSSPSSLYYNKPVRVRVEEKYVRAAEGGTGFAKCAGNYGAALFPTREAIKAGYDQILWTDGHLHQYIEESGTMNVMFVLKGNKILTSPVSGTILDGVTRKSILQIGREWGYEVIEERLSVETVIQAAHDGHLLEAFGAGTAATVSSICMIGYKGTDFELPEVTESSFSRRILAYMEALKRGQIEDTHNWIKTIKTA